MNICIKCGEIILPERGCECAKSEPPVAGSASGSAALSELSELINAARSRAFMEHGIEYRWLLELPLTDAQWKRLNELTGWSSWKQPNDKLTHGATP